MKLLTHKEYMSQNKGEEKSSPIIKQEKQEVEEKDKIEYWLRHPDFPYVKEGDYIIENKTIAIENGCIKTTDSFIKEKLIEKGFYYLGSKKDGKYAIR
jgi:hypothetical protein